MYIGVRDCTRAHPFSSIEYHTKKVNKAIYHIMDKTISIYQRIHDNDNIVANVSQTNSQNAVTIGSITQLKPSHLEWHKKMSNFATYTYQNYANWHLLNTFVILRNSQNNPRPNLNYTGLKFTSYAKRSFMKSCVVNWNQHNGYFIFAPGKNDHIINV